MFSTVVPIVIYEVCKGRASDRWSLIGSFTSAHAPLLARSSSSRCLQVPLLPPRRSISVLEHSDVFSHVWSEESLIQTPYICCHSVLLRSWWCFCSLWCDFRRQANAIRGSAVCVYSKKDDIEAAFRSPTKVYRGEKGTATVNANVSLWLHTRAREAAVLFLVVTQSFTRALVCSSALCCSTHWTLSPTKRHLFL